MKIISNFLVKIAIFLMLISQSVVSQAQVNMTKIKDATIPSTPIVPVPGAVLELESNNKGFLVPRMTTAQRDAIPSANRADGLLIYNTTTGCFNHWSTAQSLWLSICGTPPPADFSISVAQCSAITINGTYTQGTALNTTNFLTIPVTVSQPGNYAISATTTNGYYFEKSGNFPASGNYVLNLQGTGTPNNATANPGDVVTLTLNGKPSTTCNPNIPIIPAAVSYAINCSSATVTGTYNIGIPLTASNKITIPVTVSAPGFWSASTTTINGIKFSGTGTFTAVGAATIELLGTGTPTASGANTFAITTNSSTGASCPGVSVTVPPVAYTFNCGSATPNGIYMEQVALNSSNTITLPVNVTATGNTVISTNTINGISFTSGPITLSALGIQNVVLTGSGTPTAPETSTFLVSGIPGAAATCNLNLTITPQPVAYTLNCGSLGAPAGNYAPGIAMTAANTLSVPVNVTYKGAYTISTNTVNGISFSASGVFSTTGAQTITLTASGTPISGGSFTYIISSNSTSSAATCTTNITFTLRTMRVLALGNTGFYAGDTPTNSANGILTSTSNFSTTGTVRVQSVTVTAGGVPLGGSALRTLINNNNIDVILINYNYNPDAAAVNVLNDFVKNKKGVIIHSQEGAGTVSCENLVNTICGSSTANITSQTSSSYLNPILSVNDPILNGPFGDFRGLNLGTYNLDAYYFGGLPANTTTLATQSGNAARVFAFKHNTLGYLFVGEAGWSTGTSTDSFTNIYPAKMDGSGKPLPKAYNGGNIYNAGVYANALAWAFGYAQQNTVTTYVIP